MVKQLIDTVKANSKAFDWVAKFGAAVVIGLYLVWFVCGVLTKLVEAQLRVADRNTEAMQIMAATSQKIADNTDSNKEMTRSLIASLKSRADEHSKQFEAIVNFDKRIDKQDATMQESIGLQKQIIQEGKQRLGVQTQILGMIEKYMAEKK